MTRTPTFDKRLAAARIRAAKRAAKLGEPVFILRGSAGFLTLTEQEAIDNDRTDTPPLETAEPPHNHRKG
jgi:hypothetical protein